MAQLVCNGAAMQCSFGMAPSSLVVLPDAQVLTSDMPAAAVTDMVPMTNVPPFGMCMSPANPEVASATAAAMGTLTPMPCVPVVAGPWVPGVDTVLVGGAPAVDETCTCTCTWGGLISVVAPGQETVIAG
jgi:hypothetical protein